MTRGRSYQGSIEALSYRLRKFGDIVKDCVIECAREDEGMILSFVRDQQLYEMGYNGQDRGDALGNGVDIWSYAPYAPRTIKNKKRANQPSDRVTLKKSGDFYRGMYVHVDDNGFYVDSSDWKTDKLKKKYGSSILRLSNRNFNTLLGIWKKYKLPHKIKAKLMEGM